MTLIDPADAPRKTALAPDLRRLDERAARAWTEAMAVRSLPGSRYAVDSESGATYVVDATTGSCTCPDHEIRGRRCKHVRRVAIEITAGRVPPPGQVRAVCDACETETFVPEDAPTPHLCATCALDPGAVVLDRETGDRLVVVRVTDRRADDVRVDAADCTVAAYPTNEGYPADDVVVEVAYLGDGDRRYSFPRSRLRRTDDAALLA
ncbi:SWIM zinc finger family protein [Halomicrobium mukohataei]|uniref:SWIM zinc finger family protein n=1 Tax=Halomicrobium mukohataei TaxID=57705 RepID=A0A847UAQ9_9EURY|nr:SWIM zinc finger family protein [Halomicrobium mukohataei]NLV09327.1 SWIM zinc finger family protein [Halomicrobium mukohataei]